EGATSFAGVPYTYEMMDRLRMRELFPDSLRTLTQAGGHLREDLLRGDENRGRLYTGDLA
ncbi:MAG: hypothetical protein IJU29_08195, partial [Oscillospiraceae bacterium]|nr:hypothetical protein [Oscillospiraceae bacterium]